MPARTRYRPIQDLLADAFANRPDLEQAGVQVENSQISLEGSRNDLLPEMDLVGVMQNNGLAGQANPLSAVVDPAFIGGYGGALGADFARNYPTYGVGLQLLCPYATVSRKPTWPATKSSCGKRRSVWTIAQSGAAGSGRRAGSHAPRPGFL